MGCDIHAYREKKVNGVWVAADEWVVECEGESPSVPWEKRFTDRNYDLFGLLSKGVRREFDFSFEPRGMPTNACAEVRHDYEGWGCDAHSASYLYLHELKDKLAELQTAQLPVSGLKDKDELAALRASLETDSPDYDLIYPYCQGSNSPNYEHFEIMLPATFVVSGLDRLIAMFDDVEGDDSEKRLVFWFDN